MGRSQKKNFLAPLYQSFRAAIENAMGEEITISDRHPRDGKIDKVPALIYSLESILPAREQPSDGRTALDTRWGVSIYASKDDQDDADIYVRNVALAIAHGLSNIVFEEEAQPCQLVSGMDSNFDDDYPYEIWVLEFEAEMWIGDPECSDQQLGRLISYGSGPGYDVPTSSEEGGDA
jgi:hypothetical protein